MGETATPSLDSQPDALSGRGDSAPARADAPAQIGEPSAPERDMPAGSAGKSMRICLVSQEYPPETARGGIGTQTYLKAHGLAALGHDVRVISRSADAKTALYRDGLVKVTRIPGLEHETPIYTIEADWLTYSVRVASAVAAIHEQSPLDLVDFPEWGCEGYVHLLNRTVYNSVPTVIHLHGPLIMFAHAIGWPEIGSAFYDAGTSMERACVRLADRVFSSSHCSVDWCRRHYGLDADRTPVLHAGVETALFRPLPVPRDDRPTIVFAGNLSKNKGVDLLVEAACAVAAEFPGLRLKLIGAGKPSYVAKLRKVAAAAGFPELLDLPGFVRREELPEHFCASDIFAAPSCYEGGPGFVYLEAMACGLPVIACSGSGAAEVVKDGINGILVPPHDRAALIVALRRLLGDRGARQAMGEAGRRFVHEHADTGACVNRLEHFYASVIAECAATRAAGGDA